MYQYYQFLTRERLYEKYLSVHKFIIYLLPLSHNDITILKILEYFEYLADGNMYSLRNLYDVTKYPKSNIFKCIIRYTYLIN